MFDLIRKIVQTKTVTKTNLFDEAPPRYRGKPVFSENECSGCEICAAICPAGAINIDRKGVSITLSLTYMNCIFCGLCTEQCETKLIQATNEYRLAAKNKNNLIVSVEKTVKMQKPLPSRKGE